MRVKKGKGWLKMDKLGYKVYYNGEKFVAEENPSNVEAETSDGTNMWFENIIHAKKGAESLNNDLKNGDIVVKTCRDCGRYFILTMERINWFLDKGLKEPRRCDSCLKYKAKLSKVLM